jgi:hypothetical protein
MNDDDATTTALTECMNANECARFLGLNRKTVW